MLQLQSQNSQTGAIHAHYLHIIHMSVYDNWNHGLYINQHITALTVSDFTTQILLTLKQNNFLNTFPTFSTVHPVYVLVNITKGTGL